MARVDLALYAGIGVFATLIALPTTRWILAEDADFTTGGWGQSMDFNPPMAASDMRIYDPNYWPNNTPQEQLACAIFRANSIRDGQRETPYCKSLREFCTTHPDNVLAWTSLLRYQSTMQPSPQKGDRDTDEVRERLNWLTRATQEGERLEPANGFFPSMQAAIEMRAGHWDSARQCLLRAGVAPHFNDHTADEIQLGQQMVEKRWGYRGATSEAVLTVNTLLSQMMWLRNNLPPIVTHSGKPDELARQAAVNLGIRIAHEGYAPVSRYIGYCMAGDAIEGLARAEFIEDDRPVLQAAAALDAKQPGNKYSGQWRRIPKPNRKFVTDFVAIRDLYNASLPTLPYAPTFALLMAVYSIPVFGLTALMSLFKGWLRRGKEVKRWREITPGVFGLTSLACLSVGTLFCRPLHMEYCAWGLLILAAPIPILLSPGCKLRIKPWIAGVICLASLVVLASIPDRLHRDATLGAMTREMQEAPR